MKDQESRALTRLIEERIALAKDLSGEIQEVIARTRLLIAQNQAMMEQNEKLIRSIFGELDKQKG